MTDLRKKINEVIADVNQPLWFPTMTDDLVLAETVSLKNRYGVTRKTYSTTRIITGLDKFSRVRDVGSLPVEIGSRQTIARYSTQGIEFYDESDIQAYCREILIGSCRLLQTLSSLWKTVRAVVWSVHLLKAPANELDLSFSEPELPFSIFVSTTERDGCIERVRLLESIVHEAMHLNLSLVESHTRLTRQEDHQFYSPWKGMKRPVSNVLHGAYVFRAILDALLTINNSRAITSELHAYLHSRTSTIKSQLNEVQGLFDCPGLTLTGNVLLKRILTNL